MSEPTTEKLARELDKLPGVPPQMIQQARAGYYDDYKSPLVSPIHQLVQDLAKIGTSAAVDFIDRVKDGEFDGTREDAEEWGKSPEGQDAFRQLWRY